MKLGVYAICLSYWSIYEHPFFQHQKLDIINGQFKFKFSFKKKCQQNKVSSQKNDVKLLTASKIKQEQVFESRRYLIYIGRYENIPVVPKI